MLAITAKRDTYVGFALLFLGLKTVKKKSVRNISAPWASLRFLEIEKLYAQRRI